MFINLMSMFAPVAQWIEQDGSNVKVAGSSPAGGTRFGKIYEKREKFQ